MRAFVTGGGGFLGTRIVELLRARGDEVVSYSRAAHPHLERLGARCERGDVCDARALELAMRGADIVFHVAAKAGVWGPRAEFERVNVEGTRAVLAAARVNAITRFVHTSSPSVCFDGRDHVAASNDLSHASQWTCDYPRTKAEAERMVLAAHAPDFATCALRPHLVFGPGDPHLLPRVVARARQGKLVVVGDGTNRVSLTFVDNAAWAHLDAADRLEPRARHAGRAYFVNQAEPVVLWTWIGELVKALGLPAPRRRVSLGSARVLGRSCEVLWRLLGRASEPPLTRFVAEQLATTHTYSLAPARADFGYEERVSLSDATARTLEDLRAQETSGGGPSAALLRPASSAR